MADPRKRANEPEPRPIIVKKVIADNHSGHHGGAWKVAYADFVTAMMAFFLLMWLLGATTDKQRKGLADYFTPTLVQMKMESAGSNGLFGGDSLIAKENYPTTGGQGNLTITIPRDATGVRDRGGDDFKDRDRQKFERLKRSLEAKLDATPALRRLRANVKFTETTEGLRIDLVDEADFAMFAMGTDTLLPPARQLLKQVATVIADVPNDVIVRGHTDSLPYAAGQTMNNWRLSAARAEATREALAQDNVTARRFVRIEGVADREPFVPDNRYDPRNRRMSVILAWSHGGQSAAGKIAGKADGKSGGPAGGDAGGGAVDRGARAVTRLERETTMLDMGGTALPKGAKIINADSISKRDGLTMPGHGSTTIH